MAKFEVKITSEKGTLYDTIEASSKEEAVNKALKDNGVTLEDVEEVYAFELIESFEVYQKGGSIGEKPGKAIATFDDEQDAKDKAKRMNKLLSPGEKKYYGISYKVRQVESKQQISKSKSANESLIEGLKAMNEEWDFLGLVDYAMGHYYQDDIDGYLEYLEVIKKKGWLNKFVDYVTKNWSVTKADLKLNYLEEVNTTDEKG